MTATGILRRAYAALELGFDRALGGQHNPWRHLGALGFFCFWVLAVTGIYLYIVLDTSVEGVYRSMDSLSREQWYFGGILRSLHRYAADAFVLVTVLHLLREFSLGRYHGFRLYSWLTGVPLLFFIYVSGIVGFWLTWDQLAQFSLAATAEWLDVLPIFSSPLTRNVLVNTAVSDRLFTLFIFVHIGVPLLMVFALWFHIQRITHAEIFPPRPLAAGTLLALLVLSLIQPVASAAPADLAQLPATLDIDWFYLFAHPLMYATSAWTLWGVLLAAALLLLSLPFWPRRTPRAPVAVVDPPNCNGCSRCFHDCPYAAIVMAPHPSGKAGQQIAVVDADLCASCGICAGSCPSSMPFRSAAELVTGIDMPQLPVDALRQQLEVALAGAAGRAPIVVFSCAEGASSPLLDDPGFVSLRLLCTGMLPPSFIQYALRCGAQGVAVVRCREAGCAYRLGSRWTRERLAGVREPHLRGSVDAERLQQIEADLGEEAVLKQGLLDFRQRLLAQPGHTDKVPPKRISS